MTYFWMHCASLYWSRSCADLSISYGWLVAYVQHLESWILCSCVLFLTLILILLRGVCSCHKRCSFHPLASHWYGSLFAKALVESYCLCYWFNWSLRKKSWTLHCSHWQSHSLSLCCPLAWVYCIQMLQTLWANFATHWACFQIYPYSGRQTFLNWFDSILSLVQHWNFSCLSLVNWFSFSEGPYLLELHLNLSFRALLV